MTTEYESRSAQAVEFVRILADSLVTLPDAGPAHAELASALHDAADQIPTSDAQEPAHTLCAQRGTGLHTEPCDRPQLHRGMHSWEADRQRRRVHEYETTAALVPGLRAQLGRRDTEVAKLKKDLVAERLRFRALKMRRADRAARRAIREDERG